MLVKYNVVSQIARKYRIGHVSLSRVCKIIKDDFENKKTGLAKYVATLMNLTNSIIRDESILQIIKIKNFKN